MANLRMEIFEKEDGIHEVMFTFTNDLYQSVIDLLGNIFEFGFLSCKEETILDETQITITTQDEEDIELAKEYMMIIYRRIAAIETICLN
jgi:hypothetical protein